MSLVSLHVPLFPRVWSELPRDILFDIFTRLGNLHDQSHFSKVCCSWRDFANSVALPPCLLHPWKIESNSRSFLPYPYSNTLNYELPEMQEKFLHPTSRGSWFLMLGLDPEVTLFNPITGSQMHLPPLTTIDAVHFDASQKGKEYALYRTGGDVCGCLVRTCSLQNIRSAFITKVVISSSSKDLCSEIVMIVVQCCRRYAYFCKPGSKQWSALTLCLAEIYDVAYSTGHFYIMDYGGRIQVVSCSDLNGTSDPTKLSLHILGVPKDEVPEPKAHDCRLIGSQRGLFLIRANDNEKSTAHFDVFSLETNQQHGPFWQKVNSVCDMAFFIHRGVEGLSFSIVDAMHQLKGNRIYFPVFLRLDDGHAYVHDPLVEQEESVSLRCDIKVYDISNNSFGSCPTECIADSKDKPWHAPWFIPSFD